MACSRVGASCRAALGKSFLLQGRIGRKQSELLGYAAHDGILTQRHWKTTGLEQHQPRSLIGINETKSVRSLLRACALIVISSNGSSTSSSSSHNRLRSSHAFVAGEQFGSAWHVRTEAKTFYQKW